MHETATVLATEPGSSFLLDEVAIYNRPLNSTEVSEHFNAGGGAAFATIRARVQGTALAAEILGDH